MTDTPIKATDLGHAKSVTQTLKDDLEARWTRALAERQPIDAELGHLARLMRPSEGEP